MKPLLPYTLATCLLAPLGAFAQSDDAPVPYDDDATQAPAPRRSGGHRDEALREDDEAEQEREQHKPLAGADDPNVGVGGEVVLGAMLRESSRGAGVDARFGFGLRATWEFGRLLSDEAWRERLFADLQWAFSVTSDGTTQLSTTTANHLFTVAPALAFPLNGPKGTVAVYGQLGVGLDANFSTLIVDKEATPLTGSRFVFQYGLGLRGRPALVDDGHLRLTFRIEVTRFIRGYMHDTFLGASIGALF